MQKEKEIVELKMFNDAEATKADQSGFLWAIRNTIPVLDDGDVMHLASPKSRSKALCGETYVKRLGENDCYSGCDKCHRIANDKAALEPAPEPDPVEVDALMKEKAKLEGIREKQIARERDASIASDRRKATVKKHHQQSKASRSAQWKAQKQRKENRKRSKGR